MDANQEKEELISELRRLRVRLGELELQERDFGLRKFREEMFARAFNYNPDPLAISTIDEGRYIEVNLAFTEVSGYRREEIIGYTASELGIYPVSEFRDSMFELLKKQGIINDWETGFKNRWGDIITALLSVRIIELAGEPFLLNLCKNITELKKLEEALHLSEESFSRAFNAIPIGMSISTFEEGILLDVNKCLSRIIGINREGLIGNTLQELGGWINPNQRNEIIELLRKNGSISEMEFHFHKADGEARVGSLSAELFDINGEPCILGLLVDHTERNKLEIEMGRLERLNLVGEMAASIAHEIRNPMTTVRGYLQILRHNQDYIKEVDYLDLMIEELDNANSIISEFISLAKNKMVELKKTNLNSILKNIFPLLQANAVLQDKVIAIDTSEIPDLLLDEKEISQLVLNLVKNGLESMPAGGMIRIKTYSSGGAVTLVVQDEGNGVDPKILPKLGTPFFSTKVQGAGLGLAVCYGIAARHGAKIEIDTGPQGTNIIVRFGNDCN